MGFQPPVLNSISQSMVSHRKTPELMRYTGDSLYRYAAGETLKPDPISRVHRANKTDRFTESVIREMTRLALQYGAINLAQGFPDFPAPDEVKQAACDAVMADQNQYAITWGAQELRDALAQKIRSYNHLDYHPETEITVTCGSTEAMIASLLAHIAPGDEVIIPEPFYENYGPDTIIAGAVPRFIPPGADLSLDIDALTSAFNGKTQAIVLNTPNNPAGKIYPLRDLRAIADLCIDYDAIAITDEIYEHILYDGGMHVSIGSLDGMHDRTITIGSFSKTYSVTGWRVGYAIAAGHLTGPIRKIHDFLTVGAPAPLQQACVAALHLPASYYQGLAESYDKKRRILFRGLVDAGFGCVLPEGAYYILADISGFGTDDLSFSRRLVSEIGVAAVPGSSFYQNGGRNFVRFTFSKKDSTLEEACRRLQKLNGY
jgi:L-glutamine---4-(methylsulfanyl)-2-oxobutanoate aminotransferase